MMTIDSHYPDQDQSVVTVNNIYSQKITIQSVQHAPEYLQYKINHQSNLTLTSGLAYSLTTLLIVWLWFHKCQESLLWTIFLITVCLVLSVIYLCQVYEESVMVIKDLGLQLIVTYKSGYRNVRFLTVDNIANIVINEAITMQMVIFYVSVLMKNEELVPLFTSSNPRLRELTIMYHKMNNVLFPSKPLD